MTGELHPVCHPQRSSQFPQLRRVRTFSDEAEPGPGRLETGERADGQVLALLHGEAAGADDQWLGRAARSGPLDAKALGIDAVGNDRHPRETLAEHAAAGGSLLFGDGDDNIGPRGGHALVRPVGRCHRATDEPRPAMRSEARGRCPLAQ